MSVRASARILVGVLAVPTVLMAGACEKAPTPPRNDSLAKATILPAATAGQVAGTTAGATREAREPRSATASTVWFRWTAPSSGVVTFAGAGGVPMIIDAYTGPALGKLRPASSDEFSAAAGFRVARGTHYAIRVTTFTGSNFRLKWSTSAAPTNNQRATAAPISGASGSVITDSAAATVETTDPRVDGFQLPASVWYRWTAPATGFYRFDTHGSDVSTGLGVYTDSNPLQRLDDSSGSCGGLSYFDTATADVGIAATAGNDYLILVGGSNADEPNAAAVGGPLQLNWRPQAAAPAAAGNDAFASPAILKGTYGTVSGNTVGATAEPNEPAHAGSAARSSVWFSWTPTVTADYVIGSLPDGSSGCPARIDVYRGNSLASLTRVRSAEPSTFSTARLISGTAKDGIDSPSPDAARVHLSAGVTYRVAADRLGQSGPFILQWDIPQARPVIRSATSGNGSIGVIWSPPPRTAGSARTAYFVTAVPADFDGFDMSEPQTLPVTSAFTTIRGLRNGTSYRILVAAVNSIGIGEPAISRPVTPKKP